MLHFSTQPSLFYRRERLCPSVHRDEAREPMRTILATSSFGRPMIGAKRSLLADRQPFGVVVAPKNLAKNVLVAALIASNQAIAEFHEYEVRLQEAEDPRSVEEFNWGAAIKRAAPQFYYQVVRIQTTSIIRKLYEAWAVMSLSAKVADRITKDVGRSLQRKLARYPRWTACTRLFHTTMWASCLQYCSIFSVDLLERLLQDFRAWSNKTVRPVVDMQFVRDYVLSLATFSARRAVVWSSAWVAMSAGYTVGAYVHTEYGGQFGSVIFEVLGTLAASALMAN